MMLTLGLPFASMMIARNWRGRVIMVPLKSIVIRRAPIRVPPILLLVFLLLFGVALVSVRFVKSSSLACTAWSSLPSIIVLTWRVHVTILLIMLSTVTIHVLLMHSLVRIGRGGSTRIASTRRRGWWGHYSKTISHLRRIGLHLWLHLLLQSSLLLLWHIATGIYLLLHLLLGIVIQLMRWIGLPGRHTSKLRWLLYLLQGHCVLRRITGRHDILSSSHGRWSRHTGRRWRWPLREERIGHSGLSHERKWLRLLLYHLSWR
mmetsp:Transcript_23248/g.42789  ORF Transcript_23248/g.42789 Transcript_23248/m.42789 type:complete len:261 (-) Transcript_23248:1339-2121(-)